MPAVHLPDVPESVLKVLERRAQRNHHSLQAEVLEILTALAWQETPPKSVPPLKLHLSEAAPRSSWSREEIYRDDGR